MASRFCDVWGCTSTTHYAKGMCVKHYRRLRFRTDARRASEREQKLRIRVKNKAVMDNLKAERGCALCGSFQELEFHHVRGRKRFSIGRSYQRSLKALIAEALKCDVLCAPCHIDVDPQRAHFEFRGPRESSLYDDPRFITLEEAGL